jgi:hypothetical protein
MGFLRDPERLVPDLAAALGASMALSDLRLALLTFAQRWDGNRIAATVLVVPSGDPTQPLMAGAKAFAGAPVKLCAALIAGLDAFPATTAPSQALALPAPAHAAALFNHLKGRFKPIDTVAKPPAKAKPMGSVRKALPESYLAQLPPGGSTSIYVASADEYGCTINARDPRPLPKHRPDPSWGAVISHALRNPPLADALGLRYEFSVAIANPADYDEGGWLFVTLDPSDGGTGYAAGWTATPDAVKCYAARLPPLTAKRQLFSAVLFPASNPAAPPVIPDEAVLDQAIIEAEAYDDGFAKIVHARQPDTLDAHIGDGKTDVNPASDVGVQIGWDDEQVLEWQNRQMAISHAAESGAPAALESPLGVLGYRIDVREPAPGEPPSKANKGWRSLMGASATVPPALAGQLKAFDGELTIEPTASSPDRSIAFWLPLYFAQWRGTPIGSRDDTPHLLGGGIAAGIVKGPAPSLFTGDDVPALVYGHTYEFRTRLADVSGGGPTVSDLPVNETIAERARVEFQRFLPPKGFGLKPAVNAARTNQQPDSITLRRPIIGYPEALFTQRYGGDGAAREAARSAMLAQLGLGPDGTPLPAANRVEDPGSIGLPDPDVVRVVIVVEARALAHDIGTDVSDDGIFTQVYTTSRDIPALAAIPVGAGGHVRPADTAKDVGIPPIEFDYVDIEEIAGLGAPATGAIPIPRSRDVRLLLTPIADGHAGHFANLPAGVNRPDPTRGVTSHVLLRADAQSEAKPLFGDPLSGKPALQAMFFQKVTDGDPVAAMMSAMADALALDFDGLTLRARPGERVVFGASSGFKNTIAPDGSTFTFAAAAEVFRKWTVVLQQQLLRDWTWDGLVGDCLAVIGGGQNIATLNVPRIASTESLAGLSVRTTTRLVFIDGIDPAIHDPADGLGDRPPYHVEATVMKEGAPNPVTLSSAPLQLELPVVVTPTGVPQLVSAGYALSDYHPVGNYSSTVVRERNLWLQLHDAPADGDSLFARILAYAPDPVLYVDPALLAAKPPTEPAIVLDPELIRIVTPRQPRDEDGMEAMVKLEVSPSNPRAFLLPIPAGLSRDDPRLFGMWTYEFRFGHVKPWSTAHGRFGRPLRVTGIQHPAPHLTCGAAWRPLGSKLVEHHLMYEAGIGGKMLHVPYGLVVTAPYATPVLDGRRVGDGFPRTTIGFLVYAQAHQAGGRGYRNILLRHRGATPLRSGQHRIDYGAAHFTQEEIVLVLREFGLPANAPLSVLAVEFYGPGGTVGSEYREFRAKPIEMAAERLDERLDERIIDVENYEMPDPFARNVFGRRRILRTSPLTAVQPVC